MLRTRLGALVALGLLLAACNDPNTNSSEIGIEAHPEALQFPRTFVGYPTELPLELHDLGRTRLQAEIVIEAPFSVSTTEVELSPGAPLVLAITFAPQAAGSSEARALLIYEGRSLLVPLSGVAEAPPPRPAVARCHALRFDPLAGLWLDEPQADGTDCTLEDQCLTAARCEGGECLGKARDCDDSNACTTDSCDPMFGCVHVDVSESCPAPTELCKVAVCVPESGCGVGNADDGTLCGNADCRTADICLFGSCTTVPVPDGTTCVPATPCQDRGVCRNQACLRPPPRAMSPDWTYASPEQLELRFPGTVDAHDHLYLLEVSEERALLVSLTKDGFLRYRQPLGPGKWDSLDVQVALDPPGERIYLTDGHQRIEARSAADGALSWDRDVLGLLPSEAIAGYEPSFSVNSLSPHPGRGPVLVSVMVGQDSHRSFLQALEADSGAEKWRWSEPGHFLNVIADAAGNSYLAAHGCSGEGSRLLSVGRDGMVRWTLAGEALPTALAAGWLFVAEPFVGLTAIGPGTSRIQYTVDVPLSVYDEVLSGPRNLLLWKRSGVEPDLSYALLSLDGLDATELWSIPVRHPPLPGASLVTDRDGLLTVTGDPAAGQTPVHTLRLLGLGAREVFTCDLPGELRGRTALAAERWVANVGGSLQAFAAPLQRPAASGWITADGSQSRARQPR
ncbi:MAG: hypothetical protein HY901_06150 [Deltaproteobacteria bacterium]|nr:hypothetical protein [Deltaproteobacteria bacterium]